MNENMSEPEILKWGRYRVMRFLPGDKIASLRSYAEQNADGISLSSRDGCSIESLKVLSEFKGLKILLLRGLPDLDMEGLSALPELEEISLDDVVRAIDLSMLPPLRRLSGDWRKNLLRNAHQSGITSLRLSKYKSVAGDLADFPAFPELQELELVQSTIHSLGGVSRFDKLRKIELHYMNKLEALGPLHLPHLRSFIVSVCKKIADYEQLGNCGNLEELKLNDCGPIKTIAFVERLKKLKTFRFMKTDVLDGDLLPLRRLDDVYFTEKKHFSHKTSDLNQSSYSVAYK
jgi:hypothetical protein